MRKKKFNIFFTEVNPNRNLVVDSLFCKLCENHNYCLRCEQNCLGLGLPYKSRFWQNSSFLRPCAGVSPVNHFVPGIFELSHRIGFFEVKILYIILFLALNRNPQKMAVSFLKTYFLSSSQIRGKSRFSDLLSQFSASKIYGNSIWA